MIFFFGKSTEENNGLIVLHWKRNPNSDKVQFAEFLQFVSYVAIFFHWNEEMWELKSFLTEDR